MSLSPATLRPATLADAPNLAGAHARSFPTPWDADELADLMTTPGGFGLLIEHEDGPAKVVDGFIVCRALAGEAEVLTLAVEPAARGRGLGRALLEAALGLARAAGASAMFLEVAANNAPAISLYERSGFEQVGLRPRYYASGREAPVDALVYRRAPP